MTRKRHRYWSPSSARIVVSTAVWISALVLANPVAAQNPDWRKVENPYQEDVEYSVGATHRPMVEIDGVRWRSFGIELSDLGPVADTEKVSADVILEFENRRAKSAKILVILLLEDENGGPLDRIETTPFKLASGRLKEKKETFKLSAGKLKAVRRVYLFFEVVQ